ncbi:hypothetical protein E4656_19230 [Natronospirillum operosum]|uniref:Periplasmic heavy metal sensor n=1 Tax=Natronospirillum operosum TaxID=2759953 RepID=A0A4Z0W9U2_9GAMM|nr:hypothetical protein [Natronospirillum operosum]TGG90260.1 hypothetical protein E4656_19230 [Natronospirillum operosum]
MLVATVLISHPLLGHDQTHEHEHQGSEDQQSQAIASLSTQDIAQLRAGAGWDLALPAELNGVPGPAHLLELEQEIELDARQAGQIRGLEDAMRTAAIEEGERFIELEAELNRRFRERAIDKEILQDLLGEIAESRARLRHVHLATHLDTLEILHEEQIDRYNTLREQQRN